MPQIITVITLIIGFLINIVISWYLGSARGDKKEGFRYLDISALSIIIFFIIARVLGIILFWDEFQGKGWSFLPITQPKQEVQFFENWPWLFFQFTDGKFLFLEAATSLFFGFHILSLFQSLKNKKKQILLYKFIPIIYSVSLIPFAVAMYINQYMIADFSPNISLFFLLNLIFLVLFSLIIVKDQITMQVGILLVQLMGLIFLNIAVEDHVLFSNNINVVNFIIFIIIAFTIVQVISTLLRSFRKISKNDLSKQRQS